ALASVGPSTTYREVEAHLRAAGWTPCGAGDWAFALASPGGDVVARISPFDPVGPYTARLYREAAGTELVPRLLAHHRLAGGADLQVWSVWRRSRRRLRPSSWSGSRGPSPRSPRSRPWCVGCMTWLCASWRGAVRWTRTRRTSCARPTGTWC